MYITQSLSNCQYSKYEYDSMAVEVIRLADYRERIRNIREDHDLTQADIGRLLNKSQQGYNHIEAGRAELKIEDLITLCKFYNVSADYLIGLTNTKRPNK